MTIRDAIRQKFEEKTTNELLAIWTDNDRSAWSEDALAVTGAILRERGVDLPPQRTVNICKVCKQETAIGETFCKTCGFDFLGDEEGAAPIQFDYPEVPIAYKPSGKTTMAALVRMVLTGLLVGGLGGVTVGLLSALTGYLVIIVSILVAALIVIATMRASVIAMNRNRLLAAITAGGSGLLALIIIYVGFVGFEGPGLTKIINFVLLVIATSLSAYQGVHELAFCELCNKYMANKSVGKIPVRMEHKLLSLLREGTYEASSIRELIAYPLGDELNFCDITMDFCDKCYNGYLHVNTVKSRRDQKKRVQTEARLIFSAPIHKDTTMAFAVGGVSADSG